jgi:hypothetical protein
MGFGSSSTVARSGCLSYEWMDYLLIVVLVATNITSAGAVGCFKFIGHFNRRLLSLAAWIRK